MNKQAQPGIIVKSIHQRKCFFEIKHGSRGPVTSNFRFKYGFRILEDGSGVAELTLEASGFSKDTNVALYDAEIIYTGLFSCLEGYENMSLEDFLAKNAPALIMPYIRESLSGLSVKAGLPVVYLPPINIAALLKKQSDDDKALKIGKNKEQR